MVETSGRSGTWMNMFQLFRRNPRTAPPQHQGLPSSIPNTGYSTAGPSSTCSTPATRKPTLVRSAATLVDRVITDWWWWELSSWLVSFLSVAAIVTVLLVYNDKPQPKKLFFGITLNAFISIFSAIGKAALILPVSEAIGQLKWVWFRRQSKLLDFVAFDSASRGPLGSLMLLGRTKCSHPVSIGAAITVLSLAFEPFFQQIIRYPIRTVPDASQTTFISIARNYTEPELATPSYRDKSDMTYSPYSPMSQFLPGQILGMNGPSRIPPSRCPTGNCTFSEYQSLGICHQCEDVSHILTYVCANDTDFRFMDLQLPDGTPFASFSCAYVVNGTFLAGIDSFRPVAYLSTLIVGKDTLNLSSHPIISYRWNSTAFKDFTVPILDFYLAYTPGGIPEIRKGSKPVLLECLFSWCVKTFQSSFIGDRLHEMATQALLYTPSAPVTPKENQVSVTEVNITADGGERYYTVSNGTTEKIKQIMLPLIPSFREAPGNKSIAIPGLWNFFNIPPYDINPYFTNLTTEMTNVMRQQAGGIELVFGTVFTTESYVSVEWQWIILPVGLLMSSLVFLITTMVKSRRNGVGAVKSSALATLLVNVSSEVSRRFDDEKKMSGIEDLARNVNVVLDQKNGRTRQVGV